MIFVLNSSFQVVEDDYGMHKIGPASDNGAGMRGGGAAKIVAPQPAQARITRTSSLGSFSTLQNTDWNPTAEVRLA